MSRNPYEGQGNPFDKAEDERAVLGMLAGAASVAWSEPPKGEFESSWAAHLVDQAEIRIAQLREVKDARG